ncbi:AAA family ATPase [Deinococcus kurensis]|uniref:AAA family ATPase n=1 Tax=Deinococcus kurensis TaxID=2662757 RepID=UPI0012D34F13|nr:AAA family ATPase [Deinococcus kurensis]
MLKQQPGSLWFRSDPHQAIRELPGVGSKLGKRIVEDLGDGDAHEALVMIERNPYNLMQVDGFGFKKADKIALAQFNLGSEDPRRHEAGNRSILKEKGVLTEKELTAERARLELRDPAHLGSGVDIEEGLYWLPEELAAEKGLEAWMRRMTTGEPALADLTPAQQAVCDRLSLDDVQTRAVRAILANRVLSLTGGAGCGKTHVIAAAAQCVTIAGGTVRGMAFAGKAADRMREAFDRYRIMADASTIHKALGFMRREFTVPVLDEDLVVIDESSMLPNWLLWAVVMRLSPSSRLVVVGDPNQLPPIGHGTPFVDLIRHGAPRVHLERNYRQQDQQGILHVAEGILHRKRPAPADCVEFHLNTAQTNLEPLFTDLVRRHGGQDFNDWQAITYQNENAERYNLAAQAVINPDGEPLFEYPLWKLGTGERNRPLHKAEVRRGDKIIVVKNSTLLGIFNGQTGRVVDRTYKPKRVLRKQPDGSWEEELGDPMMHLVVQIGTQEGSVAIPEDELEKYVQLGYVITVHKAQGSDWDRVILIQPSAVRADTARPFFYTSATRAKTRLVIVSMLPAPTWWTNAAQDAPEVPSSLMRRLARPAPEPVCSWCLGSGEPCACNARQNDYQPEPGPEFQPTLDALSLDAPLLPSEWDEVRRAHPVRVTEPTDSAPLTVEPAAQRDDVVSAPAPQVWRTLRQRSVAETPAPDHIEALKAQFRAMEVA